MIEELIEKYWDAGARAFTTGDWGAYESIYSEDLYMVAPGFPGPITGRDVRVKLAQGLAAAFPDAYPQLLRSFGQGDWACIEVMFEGTHTGPMQGPDGTEIPPTNKTVKFPYCMVVKFKDGQCTELYEYYDQLEMLTQLGLS
jgi:predicted ester cyclase